MEEGFILLDIKYLCGFHFPSLFADIEGETVGGKGLGVSYDDGTKRNLMNWYLIHYLLMALVTV